MQREEGFIVPVPLLHQPVETWRQREPRVLCYHDLKTQNTVCIITQLLPGVCLRNMVSFTFPAANSSSLRNIVTKLLLVQNVCYSVALGSTAVIFRSCRGGKIRNHSRLNRRMGGME